LTAKDVHVTAATGQPAAFAAFGRNFLDPATPLMQIGRGELGGKALGLAHIRGELARFLGEGPYRPITVDIPSLIVLGTDVFDAFLRENRLEDLAASDESDERIAAAFLRADLPFSVLGDLRALVDQVDTPLAVRSSSLLEDALRAPFAGIYGTKMIPNGQHDADRRFQQLAEAVKFVYASTFARSAKDYRAAIGRNDPDEKMAVIIQELVGRRHHLRFYPEVSGVARTFNYYPMEPSAPEDGVVNLALGLGKTIVDGGQCWAYSPAYPHVEPPFGSVEKLLKGTQTRFWAVNLGDPTSHEPSLETEYLVHAELPVAERDDTLEHIASTYSPLSGRLSAGIGFDGPRALTFAPLLVHEVIPLNALLVDLMQACQAALGSPVEIEFALSFDPARFGLLQVRAMEGPHGETPVELAELEGPEILVASESTLGNGVVDSICDIVYTRPGAFSLTQAIVPELEELNRRLIRERRPYLLIAHGRLGTTDPWLGIPVPWGKISGARAVVETTQSNVRVELSQGSHFFHNIVSLGVKYFNLPVASRHAVDWDWLTRQPVEEETAHLRHVRLDHPLTVRLDGRRGRGLIHKPAAR
jgi:hypothetical protein